eukprot:1050534-Rhodomonas_salina.1
METTHCVLSEQYHVWARGGSAGGSSARQRFSTARGGRSRVAERFCGELDCGLWIVDVDCGCGGRGAGREMGVLCRSEGMRQGLGCGCERAFAAGVSPHGGRSSFYARATRCPVVRYHMPPVHMRYGMCGTGIRE